MQIQSIIEGRMQVSKYLERTQMTWVYATTMLIACRDQVQQHDGLTSNLQWRLLVLQLISVRRSILREYHARI
jgi:hypothetical protein